VARPSSRREQGHLGRVPEEAHGAGGAHVPGRLSRRRSASAGSTGSGKRIDDLRFAQRFTPRTKSSRWSETNRALAADLEAGA
jgi:hypothetical protein